MSTNVWDGTGGTNLWEDFTKGNLERVPNEGFVKMVRPVAGDRMILEMCIPDHVDLLRLKELKLAAEVTLRAFVRELEERRKTLVDQPDLGRLRPGEYVAEVLEDYDATSVDEPTIVPKE